MSMPEPPLVFDAKYVAPMGTESASKQEPLTDPPKDAVPLGVERYGMSKPRRIVIRARVTSD